MFEEKETITIDEYKAWLVGLIRGKKGALPDLEDWKLIKKMLDKVDSEKETVYVEKKGPSNPPTPEPFPGVDPYTPYIPYMPPPQYPGVDPYKDWKEWKSPQIVWTSDSTSDSKYVIGDGSSQLELIFEDWTK